MFTDPFFIVLVLLSLAVPVVVKVIWLNKTVSWAEVGLQCVAVSVLLCVVWWTGRYADAGDTELWNGQVEKVDARTEDCPWGWVRYRDGHCTEYRTRQVKTGETCTTDSKGKRTCTPTYTTEYKYFYPWETRYFVYADISSYEISRVDRQGASVPPRFASTKIGDPVSIKKDYYNWSLGVKQSLFHNEGVDEDDPRMKSIPEYPLRIYDYWRVDRVVPIDVTLDQQILAQANHELSLALRELGPERQMNAVVVLYNNKLGSNFPYLVERAWNGFKKNDAVVFVELDSQNQVLNSEVMSWSSKTSFNIKLRDAILRQEGNKIDVSEVIQNLHAIGMSDFKRRPMEEFSYLKDEISPPWWLYVVTFILAGSVSLGLTMLFHHEEVL